MLVRGDETEPLTVRLQPLGSATGRLLTQKGEPAANVTIDFGRTGNYGPGIRTAKTDGDGRFRVDGLAVGQKYDAILWRPNGPTRSLSFIARWKWTPAKRKTWVRPSS